MFSAKRVMDILLSVIGIITVIPFLPFVALLIKLDSKGPVFYCTNRVGKGMKIFRMYKFRTMIDTSIEVGESVSPQYDPRVTPFGRFLRRTKMNELPQLFNILKGDMTFVGPRPEAPDLAELYPDEAKEVFSAKPGLVGPATILGRNEEELYPPGVDAKKYYIENILPSKLKLDLDYCRKANLLNDFTYILIGLKETLVGSLSKRHYQENRSQLYLLLCDIFLVGCSYIFASFVFMWTMSHDAGFFGLLWSLPIVVFVRVLCNIYFGMYNCLIRYISYHEIKGVLKGVTSGTILLLLIYYVFRAFHYSALTAAIDWLCLIMLLSGLRFGLRFYWDSAHRKDDERLKKRILIYGVCDEGDAACRAFTSRRDLPFEILGFIDDGPSKYGKVMNGKKVLGNRHHIKVLAQLYRITEILVADASVHPDRLSEILTICQEANLKCRIWNSAKDIESNGGDVSPIRSPDFSDMLPHKKISANHAEVRKLLSGKTVLMNGAGGALGLELCRKTLKSGCKRLIILDRYESYLNEMVSSLFNGFPHESIVPVVTDTGKIGNVEKIFENYRPQFVFHAAMRKNRPFLAVDLEDIGQTNYLRTFNLAKAAAKFQCEAFVMISSLMAANQGNYLSDSLRVSEVSLEHFFSDSNTRLIVVRLCDIIENRGGIVSIIENQIRNRETVILASEHDQARFVSKDSGAEFILQSLAEGHNGVSGKTVFMCDSEAPVSLNEVARKLAALYGLKPGLDFAFRYTGQSDENVSNMISTMGSLSSTEVLPSLLPQSFSLLKISGEEKSLDVTHDRVKALFKDFVTGFDKESPPEEWKVITQELMNLCKVKPLHRGIAQPRVLGGPDAATKAVH
jgi:FlaA1/EpsC-like NDP-sugar epimerase/lipopolysaccharide/colanic/teichoic acid biosynthesis glycosyltransferase